jgi:hypothetical protein
MASIREFHRTQAHKIINDMFNNPTMEIHDNELDIHIPGMIMTRETSINFNITPQPDIHTAPQLHSNPVRPQNPTEIREFHRTQAHKIINDMFNNTTMEIHDDEYDRQMEELNMHITGMIMTRRTSINFNITPQPGTRTAPQLHSNPVRPQNPKETSKVIPKKKLEELCPEECAICQEIPKYKDCLYTECKHFYCKSCWDSWMNTETSNKTCPNCRVKMPKTTTYRGRGSRRQSIITQI